MARPGRPAAERGQLRIIGGRWRGRRLAFTATEGLRPTPDRVRETLFNWLAPVIRGAHCLDLFAGSGALGLEALSRGATRVDFVDISATVRPEIEGHLATLGATGEGCCYQRSAEQFLEDNRRRYDIVFVDPPFGRQLVAPVCRELDARDALAADALVYVESGAAEEAPAVPPGWHAHREKTAGKVSYRLYVVERPRCGAVPN